MEGQSLLISYPSTPKQRMHTLYSIVWKNDPYQDSAKKKSISAQRSTLHRLDYTKMDCRSYMACGFVVEDLAKVLTLKDMPGLVTISS